MATEKTSAANDTEWVAVNESASEPEIKLIFEEFGDEFEGIYLGMRTIPSQDGGYSQARFKGDDSVTYFCNANYSLKDALSKVRANSRVKVRYDSDLDTGQESPMRIFLVFVAKTKGGVTNRPGIRAGASNT